MYTERNTYKYFIKYENVDNQKWLMITYKLKPMLATEHIEYQFKPSPTRIFTEFVENVQLTIRIFKRIFCNTMISLGNDHSHHKV